MGYGVRQSNVQRVDRVAKENMVIPVGSGGDGGGWRGGGGGGGGRRRLWSQETLTHLCRQGR